MSDPLLEAKKTMAVLANAYGVLDDDVRRLDAQLIELRRQRRSAADRLRQARRALATLERRRPSD